MRKVRFWLAVAMAVALAGSGAIAATDIWLTTDAGGAKMAGDKVTVAVGATVTLHCFVDSTDIGNTFEIMVGYDKSTATTYGGGVGTWMEGKLALLSTPAVEASIPTYFDVLRSVVLDASGREDPNRPYGFVARGASTTNAAITNLKCFSFTLSNQMLTAGESQQVVVSVKPGSNSYSSAWKYGTSLRENSYVLTVETGPSSDKPTVGISNKAVIDAVNMGAAPNYIWVLWGKVSEATSTSFKIDDGSGVVITVNGTNDVQNEHYVAAKGTLDVTNPQAPTLTAQQITKYN